MLKELLSEFEEKSVSVKEIQIIDIFDNELRKQALGITDLDKEDLAEYLAFKFMPSSSDEKSSWKTYYHPMLVWKDENGLIIEFPSIKDVDYETLQYWRQRINKTKNPILAYRYADLVIDFEPVISKTGPDRSVFQKQIEFIKESGDLIKDGAFEYNQKLKRCLELAVRFKDFASIEKLKKLIIESEATAEDDLVGLWGNAFQWLVLDKPKGINISEDEKEVLIKTIRSRIIKISAETDPDPWRVEHGVRLLAEYFSRVENESELELMNLLDQLEMAFRKNKHANSSGLLIVNYLERLISIYHRYSKFNLANEAKKRLIIELSKLGDKAKDDLREVSADIKINQKEIDQFISWIFANELDTSMIRIALNFIPKKEKVKQQFNALSKRYIFLHLGGQTILSEEGFPVANLGSINEDYDSHLAQHYSQYMAIEGIFLQTVFAELRKNTIPEVILKKFCESAAFREEDVGYTLKMLNDFWKRDFLSFNALAIPLIEDCIRSLFKLTDVSYISANTSNGYDVLPLNALLHKGVIKSIFSNEDIEYYLQILLTSNIGWNLRNNFAHGLNKTNLGNENVANRLIHVLFCLSLVKRAL